MKITQSGTRFYMGVTPESTSEKAAASNNAGNRLFAGSVVDNFDLQVAGKKEEAMQKARKILGNVFSAEKSVDDDLKERSARISESEQSIAAANKELKALREEQEGLKEQYGITEDSAEYEELQLLKRRRESQKVNSGVVLTKEETEQLAAIDERGMTEYQSRYFEIESFGEPYHKAISEAQDVIKEETAIIRGIKLERLKSNPMVEASKEAETVLESANEEIIGMMMDEVKETMEEELPELPTGELLELDHVQKELKQEINTMLADMKLLAEDIKGSIVDTEL